MRKIVVLEEGDFIISIPSTGKSVVVKDNNLYVSEGTNYPLGEIEIEREI